MISPTVNSPLAYSDRTLMFAQPLYEMANERLRYTQLSIFTVRQYVHTLPLAGFYAGSAGSAGKGLRRGRRERRTLSTARGVGGARRSSASGASARGVGHENKLWTL